MRNIQLCAAKPASVALAAPAKPSTITTSKTMPTVAELGSRRAVREVSAAMMSSSQSGDPVGGPREVQLPAR